MDLKKIQMPDFKKMDKNLLNKLFLFLFIIVFIVLAIFIIKLIKGNRVIYNSIEDKMIVAAKKYFSEDETGIEEFKNISKNEISVSAEKLIEKNYLKELSKYTPNKEAICDGKVIAKSNNNYILYTALLDCKEDYKTKYLTDIIKKDIVENGDGLYLINDNYVFRGEYVNNYVKFANKTWRILRINSDNSIRIMETTVRDEIVWDDRYNIDIKSKDGINDFSVSRIKDSLIELYNNNEEFNEQDKSYINKQNLCIGKRSENDTAIDGVIECSNTYPDFMIGLLQVNEYAIASIDKNCNSPLSRSCQNYNYLSKINNSYWSITASSDKSNKVYKFVNTPIVTSANNSSRIKAVIHIDPNSTYVSGDGSFNNPYIIK